MKRRWGSGNSTHKALQWARAGCVLGKKSRAIWLEVMIREECGMVRDCQGKRVGSSDHGGLDMEIVPHPK